MGKVSVVINTLNEEENLPRALNSVKDWAYEVIVVDMESTDETVKIAKKLGAQVYSHKRMGYVEPARNFAISKTTGDWIFILDADEEVPATLRKKIQQIIKEPDADYYAVPRKNIVFGKWLKHSRWWPDYNLRLFKKGHVEWGDEIHSVPLTSGIGADIESKIDFAIIHHHYITVDQYLERLNRYTSIQAKELKKKGRKPDWRNFIKKPMAEFLSRYFAGKGYKDGFHGLALASMQSFSELVVEVKLWELYKFAERDINLLEVNAELKEAQRELSYWANDSLVNETGSLVNKIKRKFKLL